MRWLILVALIVPPPAVAQSTSFTFDRDLRATDPSARWTSDSDPEFVRGLSDQALAVRTTWRLDVQKLGGQKLGWRADRSFGLEFWVRTQTDRRMTLVTQKAITSHDLESQKERGFTFFAAHGTWGWNVGSGSRRLTYQRDNGEHMPIDDGRWHQLALSYDHELGQACLFYDGVHRATYQLRDATGFEPGSKSQLTIGGTAAAPPTFQAVRDGADALQEFVDAFRALELGPLQPDQFVDLIVDPERFVASKTANADLKALLAAEKKLMRNPFTVHQSRGFMDAAPLLKIYELQEDRIAIDRLAAARFAAEEQLTRSDFDIDELRLFERPLLPSEIRDSYARYFPPAAEARRSANDPLVAGVWNIYHGGKHFTIDEHGWDSRRAIAEIIRRQGIDVVMMQETYSAGDFIAAELGYHFATTADWDYLNQGSNISVLSRFPIREVHVPPNSSFMNVAARIELEPGRLVWVMSNWYGMRQFEDVFESHSERFGSTTPILFGGDFNAVPHTDGGDSPASRMLQDAGFADAYRVAFPDAEAFPGPTHRSGRRIDQLYFKGASLKLRSTRVIDEWPTGFPSDHSLIRVEFEIQR